MCSLQKDWFKEEPPLDHTGNKTPDPDSSSLTNEKDHHYFLNSADVCW